MRKTDIITGIGFFTTLIGFAGLAEAFQGNGKTHIALLIVVIGIGLCATQTIREWVKDIEKSDSNIADYPCYLSFRCKGRK